MLGILTLQLNLFNGMLDIRYYNSYAWLYFKRRMSPYLYT